MKKDWPQVSAIHKAYMKHQDALKRFLWRYYKRAEDVEDAAQEAFLRAFGAEARENIGNPKAFLFQTAKNFALSDIAKKSNSATDYVPDFEGSTVLEDENQVPADERLESRRKLALLAQAISELPPQCRRVFLLRKFEGMKVKDIAAHLGVTVSAVDKQLSNGLARCSDYLAVRGYAGSSSDKSENGPTVRALAATNVTKDNG